MDDVTPPEKEPGRPSVRKKASWLRFGLSALLGVVLLICCVLGVIANLRTYSSQQWAPIKAINRSGFVSFLPPDRWANELEEKYDGGWKGMLGIDLPKPVRVVALIDATDELLIETGKLPHVNRIAFTGNYRVTSKGIDSLSQSDHLESLFFYGVDITDSNLKHIAKLSRLKKLNLDFTLATDAGLQHVAQLSHLESLSLNGTSISDSGTNDLLDFGRLTNLSVRSTKITDKGLKVLSGCKSLRKLDVCGTPVTFEGVCCIAAKSGLTTLCIDGTAVSESQRQMLPTLYPRLTVEYDTSSFKREF